MNERFESPIMYTLVLKWPWSWQEVWVLYNIIYVYRYSLVHAPTSMGPFQLRKSWDHIAHGCHMIWRLWYTTQVMDEKVHAKPCSLTWHIILYICICSSYGIMLWMLYYFWTIIMELFYFSILELHDKSPISNRL